MSKRQVLGRGLSALIPTAAAVTEQENKEYMLCPVRDIHPAHDQPRQHFEERAIRTLADSIRASGILQPLVVRRSGDGFELIAGERRWRAAQLVGLEQVPVVVKEAADDEALTLALEENLQREDLNPIEEAAALRRLLQDHGRTQEQLAGRLGRDRSSIANSLRLLKLPEDVQTMVQSGAISAGHAKALLMVEDPDQQQQLAAEIATEGLSVREAERRCRGGRAAKRRKKESRAVSAGVRSLEERLQRALGTKVKLDVRGKRGQIMIDFYSFAELERLVEQLTKR